MKEIIKHLENIARLAEKSADNTAAVEAAIKEALGAVKNAGENHAVKNLDTELLTWQSKISVIMKEPAGRQGMAKHCRHWVKRLENP